MCGRDGFWEWLGRLSDVLGVAGSLVPHLWDAGIWSWLVGAMLASSAPVAAAMQGRDATQVSLLALTGIAVSAVVMDRSLAIRDRLRSRMPRLAIEPTLAEESIPGGGSHKTVRLKLRNVGKRRVYAPSVSLLRIEPDDLGLTLPLRLSADARGGSALAPKQELSIDVLMLRSSGEWKNRLIFCGSANATSRVVDPGRYVLTLSVMARPSIRADERITLETTAAGETHVKRL